jgi:ABC-type uncharacterized transport system involved in gliding motility auxiliary subunit
VLIVAGPKLELLPPEVAAIRAFLAAGGNALLMLDPFVRTGLEPLLREYGIVVDDDIVIARPATSGRMSPHRRSATTTGIRSRVTSRSPSSRGRGRCRRPPSVFPAPRWSRS